MRSREVHPGLRRGGYDPVARLSDTARRSPRTTSNSPVLPDDVDLVELHGPTDWAGGPRNAQHGDYRTVRPDESQVFDLDPIVARHRFGAPTMTRGAARAVLVFALVLAGGLAVWAFVASSGRSEIVAGQTVSSATGATSRPNAARSSGAGASAKVSLPGASSPSRDGSANTLPSDVALLGAPSNAAQVVVHVIGRVRRPGLVSLPAGARVMDAVNAAGGASTGAAMSRINLARHVQDGEQLLVPDATQPVPAQMGGASASGASGGRGTTASGGSPVNLNTATLTELDALPGVGPVTAQRILDWRQQHRFTSVNELTEVSGIGPKLYERIRALVTV